MDIFIKIFADFFILCGISSAWEFTETCLYGSSQISIVDLLAAVLITIWFDRKIWED